MRSTKHIISLTPYVQQRKNTHINHIANPRQWMEGDNLLEEIEGSVTSISMREVRDGCGSRPRDDTCEEDTNQDSTLDAVKHEEDGKNTAEEDTEPHGGALENMSRTEVGEVREHVFGLASAQTDKVGLVTADDEETTRC